MSKNLFWYDYLDYEEIKTIMGHKKLNKEKVRDWKGKKEFIEF